MMKPIEDSSNLLLLTDQTEHVPASLFNEQDYFKDVIAYYMQPVYVRIRSGLQQFDQRMLDEQPLLHSIMIHYKNKLYRMVGKTLIYEFHQTFDQYDEHSDSKYYDYFADSLRSSVMIEQMMSRYPVLQRLLYRMTEQFIAFHLHIVARFTEQYEQLCHTFNLSGSLNRLSTGAGDDHQQGKSVAILNIGSSRLLYKPRSLGVDLFYQQWIEHVNQTRGTKLRAPISIDCGTYGWQEYVQSQPCSSLEQVSEFLCTVWDTACVYVCFSRL